jgi:hypothetical protein
MERFALDADRTKLLFSIEVASEGRTVRHDEEFSVQRAPSTMKSMPS